MATKAPTVSIALPVYRPGGLDVTFASLADQTYRDFELILVDRRYEKRHDRVMDLAKRSGVTCIHVPEHRRNGKWACLGSAWNTAIMLARGKTIILMPDYAYVPPDWVQCHAAFQSRMLSVIMAPYTYIHLPPVFDKQGNLVLPAGPEEAGPLCPQTHEMPGDNFDEISIFKNRFIPRWIDELDPWPQEHQCARSNVKRLMSLPPIHGHFHMRNESMPREWALRMNGFDEQLDRGKCQLDGNFGIRLSMLGFPIIPTSEPMCWMLNPRGLFPTMPQCGEAGRWSYEECEYYGLHPMSAEAKNPYSLREKAKEIEHWREADLIPTDGLDVPDKEYY